MDDKGEFYLKGYFCDEKIEINFGEKIIQLYSNAENIEKLEKLKHEELIFSETGLLQIVGLNDKEQLEDIAIDIKDLLSIALGKRIVFDRQIYYINNSLEIKERVMSKSWNQGEQIIPDFEIKNYLQQTLPNWINYSKAQKKDIFVVTDYLNQTKHDFIEDRILRTLQAWECAANYWIGEIELSGELNELREKIKLTYNDWKKDKKGIDKDGELGKRLTNSLDQEKLMFRLEKLIEDSGLIVSKLNLNLRKLKNLRDRVAHTGRINVPGNEVAEFLQHAIKGLQLIILKRIGYNGLVYGEKDNWRTEDNINDYFQ